MPYGLTLIFHTQGALVVYTVINGLRLIILNTAVESTVTV